MITLDLAALTDAELRMMQSQNPFPNCDPSHPTYKLALAIFSEGQRRHLW